MSGGLTFHAVWASEPRGAYPAAKLYGLTGQFGPGVHLVIGGLEDGIECLLSVASGRSAPSRGDVKLADVAPHANAKTRRHIGLMDVDVGLPPGRTVAACVAQYQRWYPAADLAAVPVSSAEGALAIDALRPRQRLALAWHLALATPRPGLLLLHDPFRFGSDALRAAPGDIPAPERLRASAAAGAVVIITAPHAAPYFDMADALYSLARGRLQGGVPPRDTVRRLVLRLDPRARGDARALAAALADHDAICGVHWCERAHEASVTVDALQLEQAAQLASQAAVSLGSAVVAMAPAAPSRQHLEMALHAERPGSGASDG
jgi:hypothetical protein